MLQISPDQIKSHHTKLLGTFRKVMTPLVRLFLEKGITYTLLLDELKKVFVDVASEEFKIKDKPQTDSRISLLTGVHRRDVNKLRSVNDMTVSTKSNFSDTLISQWIGDPVFVNEDGSPKLLARSKKIEGDVTFDMLVSSISKDIRARPVLDEWLRSGVVELTEDGYVKLIADAYIPKENLDEKLFFLNMNIHDHLSAAVNNTLYQNKMFERCVYHNELTLTQINELHQLTQQYGMDYLKIINQKFVEIDDKKKQEANHEKVTEKYRMNSGVYFYYEKSPKAPQ